MGATYMLSISDSTPVTLNRFFITRIGFATTADFVFLLPWLFKVGANLLLHSYGISDAFDGDGFGKPPNRRVPHLADNYEQFS